MKTVAHTLVKNEDQWIWYSLMSVIDCVDEIMIWDTGSTDKTIDIIKSIDNPRIKYKQRIAPSSLEMTKARQEMLDETKADWLMILDGDEIWPEKSIKASIDLIRSNNNHNCLVNPYYQLLGDIHHRQEELAGKYKIGSHIGHITIRFINLNKMKGLHYQGSYPDEALLNSDKIPIQNMDPGLTGYVSEPYLHTSHLRRTSLPTPNTLSRSHQVKCEWGTKIPDDFEYPKCFYLPKTEIVPSPWTKRSFGYSLNAMWQTPLKLLKRRILD